MDNQRDDKGNNNGPGNNNGKPTGNKQSIFAFLICLLVTLVCFSLFTNMLKDNSSEITYDKFIEMVEKGQIAEVVLESDTVQIKPKSGIGLTGGAVYYTNRLEDATALTERLQGTGIIFKAESPDVLGELCSLCGVSTNPAAV